MRKQEMLRSMIRPRRAVALCFCQERARKFAVQRDMKTCLAFVLNIRPFKTFLAACALLLLAAAPARAASDADVTLLKTTKVQIEEGVITIVAEAKTRITLIRGDYDPADKGPAWMGRPVTHLQVKSDRATFTIRRPQQPGLEKAWQDSLQAARDLRDGKEVGRIGFYAPDISIKGNLIEAITGFGFLYARGN